MCEICPKSIIKTPERCRCAVFIVNFEYILHIDLLFRLLLLNKLIMAGLVTFNLKYIPCRMLKTLAISLHCNNLQQTAGLVPFTEEIHNRKLHFSCNI